VVRTALRFLLAAWALTCSGPQVLHAQDAPYRTQLNDLCEALDSAASVARVELIKARWDAPTGNPVERLGDAYAELRLGVLMTDRDLLTTSWEHFDETVRVHPDWPYARLGLAMAALEIYSRRYPVPAMYDDVVGGTHYDGYVIEMKRLLKEEPTFEPAITWLTETLSAEGDREEPGPVLALLRYAADSAGVTNPGIQLILARAERLKGNAPTSVRRVDAYLEEGGDEGVGDLEMARSLGWMGELENAAIEYLAGARVQTREARSAYRLDISWVATPRELAQYDSLPAASVGAWVGHFWDKRDVQELLPDGSRLQEHLRRWVYMNQHFRVPDPGRRTAYKEIYIPPPSNGPRFLDCLEDGPRSLDDYDYTEPARRGGGYRSPERVFDHRAIVYMRHGAPLQQFGGAVDTVVARQVGRLARVAPTGSESGHAAAPFSGMDPSLMAPNPDRNVTWVYLIGGKPRVFTFLGYQALGSNVPSTLIVDRPPNLDVMLQLAGWSSDYFRLASQTQWNAFNGALIPGSCQKWFRDVVREQREGAAVAVRTDTYLRRFAKPLAAAIQFSAIGQPTAGTGVLLAVLAVQASELTAEPVEGDTSAMGVAVRVQMAAIDSLTGESVQIDTTRHFVTTRQLVRDGAWISFAAILPLKPGLGEVRLTVSQDDDRGSIFSAPIDPASDGFSASDIVLGGETGSVPWERNGSMVMASAFSTFTVGDAVLLYYELYGLESGGTYRTTLSLRRTGNTKVASTLSFTDRAANSTMASSRTLTLNDVKPGQYELIVTVDEVATGRRVVRQRAISVGAK